MTTARDIIQACSRIKNAVDHPELITYPDMRERDDDLRTVLTAARAHADTLEGTADRKLTMERGAPIQPMSFTGIVIQHNPAMPIGHVQIIGGDGKLLASFQTGGS